MLFRSKILPLVNIVVLTEPQSNRKLNINDLEKEISHKKIFKNAQVTEAYQTALSVTAKKDVIICCGSLYMIGEIKNYISCLEVLS